MIPKSKFIWMNGKFVAWDDAKVHVGTHALHYGSSVFEGIRAYSTPRGAAVFCLDQHVERMFNSCKIFKMPVPFTQEEIRGAIVQVVGVNELKSCYIRPLVYRGFDNFSLDPRRSPVEVAIFAFEWGSYLGNESIEKGVDVGVSTWRRMAPDTFPAMGKLGGQYVNSQFIAMEAADHGYQEGIALDVYGNVSEGSGDNIFVVTGDTVYTPPLGSSILKGVTRYATMTLARDLGMNIVEQNLPREMLYVADEVFITGTAAEIVPIRSIDHVQVGRGEPGPITKKLQEQFFAVVQGRAEDRHGWLTFVNDAAPAKIDVRVSAPAK